jgi:hypothetical protein
MKYFSDKYNLTFCYASQQHGKGVIAKRLMPLAIFCIMFSQLLNMSILAAKLPEERQDYITLAVTVLILELVCLIGFWLYKMCLRYSQATQK